MMYIVVNLPTECSKSYYCVSPFTSLMMELWLDVDSMLVSLKDDDANDWFSCYTAIPVAFFIQWILL